MNVRNLTAVYGFAPTATAATAAAYDAYRPTAVNSYAIRVVSTAPPLLQPSASTVVRFDNDDEEHQQRVQYLCAYCKMVAVVLYSLLSVVAFLGNLLILAVFLFIRRLRTPTNMLIANLAVADLMISVFCIPLSYWHVIIFEDQRWIFGPFLCKIFNYLQATAVFLSSWTLVAISFDRFMAIWFVMSPWLRLNRRKAFYVIIATWLFSLFMALPLLIVNQIEESPNGVQTCLEKWELARGFLRFGNDEDGAVHAYTSLVFALQYCLPLLVLLVTYAFIGLRMWNSKVPGEPPPPVTKQPSQNGHHHNVPAATSAVNSAGNGGGGSTVVYHHAANAQTQERRHESVKKLIPMVLLVSALYAGCWLPQNLLMNIWVTYDPSITSHPYILYIWWGSHSLAMFHSIVNPFIYYWQNKRIHEAVNYLLRGCFPCASGANRHTPLRNAFDETTTNTIAQQPSKLATAALETRKKSGATAVRIVNMVAYMPVTGGQQLHHHHQHHSTPNPTSSSSSPDPLNQKNNAVTNHGRENDDAVVVTEKSANRGYATAGGGGGKRSLAAAVKVNG